MFKNLQTSTKLLILCGLFIVSLGVVSYQLIVEKKVAIDFARKELVGNRYLNTLREVYVAVLVDPPSSGSAESLPDSRAQVLNALASAEATAGGAMHTAEMESVLAAGLADLWSTKEERTSDDLSYDVLAEARSLATRIGDDSNLTLDPELDTYYLRDVIVTRLPILLGQLGELRTLLRQTDSADSPSRAHGARALVADGLLRSTMDEIRRSLLTAYHGNAGLEQAVDAAFTAMLSATTSYLDSLKASSPVGETPAVEIASTERLQKDSVRLAIDAWVVAQTELDRLLTQRISGLQGNLNANLGLLGVLACLCILFSALTYQHIARPLQRFEGVVKRVRQTKDYSLRIDHRSDDEIGKLVAAFNDMLSELAAVRAQESSDHLELGRVARLTIMGAMTASIAHEVNQPLAAIATNASAALHWLTRATPEVGESLAALRQIVGDAHGASQVIEGVRSIFKKDTRERTLISVNDLVRDVLMLAHGRLRSQRISVEVVRHEDLPQILADRVQLQQVMLNLVMNGIDAMTSVKDRTRRLLIKSELQAPCDVLITVQDAGTGISPDDMDRIFEAFFTTKSNGMGLGLSICRSIIEAHGGRLWASAGAPYGANFHIVLPAVDGLGDQ